ncbi:hypothetical protein [Spirillospora sp. NPDC029432]|uniref:hypothetical protein n=1 Tax=Spirillospora sp. NPDC029432 TaxID=3154599 RepID=UPI0034539F63
MTENSGKQQKNEKNDEHRRGERSEEAGRGADGADFTDEFRPEPVRQRESEGQAGPGEGPQVTPEEP